MKTKTYASLVAVAALTGVVAHAESRVTPFLRAEFTYTSTGYSKGFDATKSVCSAPTGYAAGAGFTTGVLFDKKHELSVSSGVTKWTGETNVISGVFFTHAESQQIPVLLNYRYHYALDQAGKYTLFAGPTVGFIHETITNVLQDPSSFVGGDTSLSASKWKPAFGGTVGLTANLTDHWTVTASAQMLHIGGSEYITNAGSGDFVTVTSSSNRPSFALSAGYSW